MAYFFSHPLLRLRTLPCSNHSANSSNDNVPAIHSSLNFRACSDQARNSTCVIFFRFYHLLTNFKSGYATAVAIGSFAGSCVSMHLAGSSKEQQSHYRIFRLKIIKLQPMWLVADLRGLQQRRQQSALNVVVGVVALTPLLPDLVAPRVNVGGIFPSGYGVMSGTSVSAAISAGASALLLEWGIINDNDMSMDSNHIRSMFLIGCERDPALSTPTTCGGTAGLTCTTPFAC